MSENNKRELGRKLGLGAVIALGVGTTVGSGIFSSLSVKRSTATWSLSIRHTASISDKVLSVSVEASKAWVSLSIRDNGPGIPKQELRRVMMPFVSTKSKTSNWGIGLPYAFRVVNAQLGQMRILSSDQAGRSYTQVDILLPRERIDT